MKSFLLLSIHLAVLLLSASASIPTHPMSMKLAAAFQHVEKEAIKHASENPIQFPTRKNRHKIGWIAPSTSPSQHQRG
eukprot:CAMPEP_0202491546 /NCGR_PEP_ID=MMETSP1361-20130828/8575_1 /ASSEMBLY_ACC=CAM_ASM_000849 /TAXON_ID=210615 /ORGANISM="Staurosira complex sp., Strain CCMP2646" /LENGTH=77 /DNA_ID=CAMNT_0049121615 /DNA_START=102 /DNA_END=335 /DNA_ORIENTATION=-